MMKLFDKRILFPVALLLATSASAAELPPAIKAMLEAAARSGDTMKIDAVVAVAKETNPDSVNQIDAIINAISGEAAKAREEKLRQAGMLDLWSGSGQLGAALSTGNSDTKSLTAGLKLARNGLHWRHSLEGLIDLVDNNAGTDQERILGSYQADWKLSPLHYIWGRLEYERNREAGIQRRFAESVGFGWQIIANPRTNWSLEAGPALRQTIFYEGAENSIAARAASRFRWNLTSRTVFTNDTAFFWENATSVSNTAALTTLLLGALSMRLSSNLSWEDNPPDGLENLDTTSRVTLVYSF